jgi:hypothetical protein
MKIKTVSAWKIKYEIIPAACIVLTVIAMWIGFKAQYRLLCLERGYQSMSITVRGVKCGSVFLRDLNCVDCFEPQIEPTITPLMERSI